eukprot:1282043-Rhodomonas_salina.1
MQQFLELVHRAVPSTNFFCEHGCRAAGPKEPCRSKGALQEPCRAPLLLRASGVPTFVPS